MILILIKYIIVSVGLIILLKLDKSESYKKIFSKLLLFFIIKILNGQRIIRDLK